MTWGGYEGAGVGREFSPRLAGVNHRPSLWGNHVVESQ